MMSIDQAHDLLDEIAEELPPAFWDELNGGVSLLPGAKRSPSARADDLYILGEYHIDRMMGRSIYIYYGSFERLFPHLSPEQLKRELRKTLFHEFTHHVESLAGEKSLEIKDAQQMQAYLAAHGETK